MNILIERTTDSCECETCGYSYADGANVYFEGVKEIVLHPVAACFDGSEYDDEDIAKAILDKLGSRLVYSTEYGCFSRTLKSMGHKIRIQEVERH